MSMAEAQAVLGRLCVDWGFREWFAPGSALACHELTQHEQAMLRGVDRGMLDVFATGLMEKRHWKLTGPLPATKILLGDRLTHCCTRYCDVQPTVPGETANDDLRGFGAFLSHQLGSESAVSGRIREMAAFEVSVARAASHPGSADRVPGPAPANGGPAVRANPEAVLLEPWPGLIGTRHTFNVVLAMQKVLDRSLKSLELVPAKPAILTDITGPQREVRVAGDILEFARMEPA